MYSLNVIIIYSPPPLLFCPILSLPPQKTLLLFAQRQNSTKKQSRPAGNWRWSLSRGKLICVKDKMFRGNSRTKEQLPRRRRKRRGEEKSLGLERERQGNTGAQGHACAIMGEWRERQTAVGPLPLPPPLLKSKPQIEIG